MKKRISPKGGKCRVPAAVKTAAVPTAAAPAARRGELEQAMSALVLENLIDQLQFLKTQIDAVLEEGLNLAKARCK